MYFIFIERCTLLHTFKSKNYTHDICFKRKSMSATFKHTL